MDLKLEGRVAMITGPAKGMGAAITLAFAAEGARLALLGRDVEVIKPVAEAAKSAGSEAIIVPCDLTDAGPMRTGGRHRPDKLMTGASIFWSMSPVALGRSVKPASRRRPWNSMTSFVST